MALGRMLILAALFLFGSHGVGGTINWEFDAVDLGFNQGVITINSIPPGAEIYIDGELIGHTPHEFIGSVKGTQLELRLDGYEPVILETIPHDGPISLIPLSKPEPILRVISRPPGAEVNIDGIYKGITPCDIPLECGVYFVSLDLEGYKRNELYKVINEDGDFLNVSLTKIDDIMLSINTEPSGAEVYIEGNKQDELTPIVVKICPGKYQFELMKQGYKSESFRREISTEEPISIKLQPILFGLPISTIPPGADIYIDEVKQEKSTPTKINIIAGNYMFKLKKEGYKPEIFYKEVLSPSDGIYKELQLQYSNVDIVTIPDGAEVTLDGINNLGQTPLLRQPIPVGTHYFTLNSFQNL